MNLHDNWCNVGSSFEAFKNVVHELSANTHVLDIKNKSLIALYSIHPELQGYRHTKLTGALLEDYSPNRSLPSQGGYVLKDPVAQELYEEAVYETVDQKPVSMLLSYGDSTSFSLQNSYFVSHHALFSLGKEANVQGTNLKNPGLIRDMYLMTGLMSSGGAKTEKGREKEKIQAVYREIVRETSHGKGYLRKIMNFRGAQWYYEPLDKMIPLCEKLLKEHPFGKGQVRKWRATQRWTDIYIDFPEHSMDIAGSTLIPGFMLRNSDTGHAGFVIYAYARIDDFGEIIYDKHGKKHITTFEAIAEDAEHYLYETAVQEFDNLLGAWCKKVTKPVQVKKLSKCYVGPASQVRKTIGSLRCEDLRGCIEAGENSTEYDAIRAVLTYQKKARLKYELDIDFSEAIAKDSLLTRKGKELEWD